MDTNDKNKKRKDLAKNILLGIAVVGIVTTVITLPGTAYIFDLIKPRDRHEKQRIKRSFCSLQKKKLIKIYSRNGKEIMELTEAGKQRVFEYKIDDMKLKKPKRWDKKWRIVMFDIPEKKRRARETLNYKLRDMGFKPLQKSIFVSPYPCKNEIDFIVNYYFIQKYIVYLETKSISNEEFLRKKFNL